MPTGSKRKHTTVKSSAPSKRKKVSSSQKQSSKGKEKAFQRSTIPIPQAAEDVDEDDEDDQFSEQDVEILQGSGSGVAFLTNLDQTAIARSKTAIDRLHKLSKPPRPKPNIAPEPLSDSDDNSIGFSNSDIEDDEELVFSDSDATPIDSDADADAKSLSADSESDSEDDSDVEKTYEQNSRKHAKSRKAEQDKASLMPRLPIKLADGSVQQLAKRRIAVDESMTAPKVYPPPSKPERPVDDVSTGARFGRPAVIDVLSTGSHAQRIKMAKQQLASISQDIIADPENSIGLLRRLHTFALPEVSSHSHPTPVANDPVIRQYAILSQVAVFKDIIPGYRIRTLTEKEKAEKVTQAVLRTREWEQGLVGAYQNFLTNTHAEIKAKSEISSVALKCLCTILVEATHFNFRVNILEVVVSQLSRKTWTESTQLCYDTLVTIFKNDRIGESSLEAVRLLNRMIKDRQFGVHPKVLTCLAHLRLKTELDVRASQTHADKKGADEKSDTRIKQKKKDRPHLSKKAKKALKENKGIQVEMKEAEAEVNREERASRQTETLKLIFVLYFGILKTVDPLTKAPGLLMAALEGISKFAHLVNIDFFRDLMAVLKALVVTCKDGFGQGSSSAITGGPTVISSGNLIRLQLLSIVTAFELLTGQGEALNIDLDQFINDLYAVILPLSTFPFVEDEFSMDDRHNNNNPSVSQPSSPANGPILAHNNETGGKIRGPSLSDLMFRALSHLFETRTSAAHIPVSRAAAFASRLTISALHFPPSTACRALTTVFNLLGRFPTLDGLLSTEDQTFGSGGAYRPEIDDIQVCHPFGSCWYAVLLLMRHTDASVRKEAQKVADFGR